MAIDTASACFLFLEVSMWTTSQGLDKNWAAGGCGGDCGGCGSGIWAVGGGGVVGEGGEGVEEDGFRISASSLLRSQLSCAIWFHTDKQIKQTETNPELEQSDQEEPRVERAINEEKIQQRNGKWLIISDLLGEDLRHETQKEKLDLDKKRSERLVGENWSFLRPK